MGAHQRAGVNHCNSRLAKIFSESADPLPAVKIREGLTEQQALDLEVALIAAIGRGDKGPLVNMTDGGDGTSGLEVSAERRAAISKRHKGKTISAEQKRRAAETNSARVWTAESREKIRQSKLGKKQNLSPEQREKNVARAREIFSRPEVKAKIAAANRAKVWTPEMRAGVAAAARRPRIKAASK